MLDVHLRCGYRDLDDLAERDERIMKCLLINVVIESADEYGRPLP